MSNDWKREADHRYAQQQAAKERPKRQISKEAEEKALQQYNEMLLYNRQVELQSHQRHFRCHIKGCPNASSGPNGSMDIPTGLLRCESCGKWACEAAHYHRNHCKDCWEYYSRTGRFPRRIKSEQWRKIGVIAFGIGGVFCFLFLCGLLTWQSFTSSFVGIIVVIMIFGALFGGGRSN